MKTVVKRHRRKIKGKIIKVKSHKRKIKRKRPRFLITWETLEKVREAKEAGIPEEQAWKAAKIDQERNFQRRFNYGMVQWKLKPEHMAKRRTKTLSRVEMYPVTKEKGYGVITKKTYIKRWPKITHEYLDVPKGKTFDDAIKERFRKQMIKERRDPDRFEIEKNIGDLEDWHITQHKKGTAKNKPGGMPWKTLRPLSMNKLVPEWVKKKNGD